MSGTGSRILVIDDEPALLRMISLYLGRHNYQVTVASTAAKARAELQASSGEFAMAVLDATLANTTLPELGDDILAASPRMRLLVVSGYPVDMSALQAAAPGRVDFLLKPFSPEMLAGAVRRMLGAEEKSV